MMGEKEISSPACSVCWGNTWKITFLYHKDSSGKETRLMLLDCENCGNQEKWELQDIEKALWVKKNASRS